MKAIANTTIRLGLINLPVGICQAVEKGNDVTFNQGGPNGEELRQAYLLPDGTECPKDQIQKGIRDGGDFHPISAEALEQIAEATKMPDLDVLEVIDREVFEAQRARTTEMYYVQSHPKNGSPSSFKLFVDVLDETGKALVVKWTARSRQKLLVLYPENGIMMGAALAFASDVRDADDAVRAHEQASYKPEEKDMAVKLIQALAGNAKNALEMEVDEALSLKRQLVDDALQGKAIATAPAAAKPADSSALADALAASLEAAKAA